MTFYGDDGEAIAYPWGPYDPTGHDLPASLPSVVDDVPVSFGYSVDAFTADGRALSIAAPMVEADLTRVEGSKTTRTRVTFWSQPNLLAIGFAATRAAVHEVDVYTPEGVTPTADVLVAVCRLAMAQPVTPGERHQSEYRIHP